MKINQLKLLSVVWLLLAALGVHAQASNPKEVIIKSMDDAALDWNKGDLDGYMALYDTSATMMTKTGRIRVGGMKQLYQQYYFDGKTPKQELSYDTYEFTQLGSNYALLSGRFVLKANGTLAQRIGTFSLIFIRRINGWKLMHDHSG